MTMAADYSYKGYAMPSHIFIVTVSVNGKQVYANVYYTIETMRAAVGELVRDYKGSNIQIVEK